MEYDCQFRITLQDCHLVTLVAAFATLLPQIFTDFLDKAIFAYADAAMKALIKPFACDRCGNDQRFIWKTKRGRPTHILTVFQWVVLRHLQVQCKACGHKFYLTRRILGLERRERIPKAVYRKLGLIGSLASYRVASKILSIVDKMTIWKAVQGGQRSLTKRRLANWPSPSIRTKRHEAKPTARACRFGALANVGRN